MRRPMTPAERRTAAPQWPWSDLALAPLTGVLAAVPAVVVAGLPLYLAMWLADVDEPGRWVSLLAVSAFALASAGALYEALGGFLRARARIDDDLLHDEVDDRIVDVTGGVEVLGDPPALYLQLAGAEAEASEAIVLIGEYVARQRRTGCFPATTLRIVQLPVSRAVLGVLPLGDVVQPVAVSRRDHHPVELDGQHAVIDVDTLRSRARWHQ